MNRLKVAFISGTIPSTVFIERLIEGLAGRGINLLLFGQIHKTVSYNSPNISVLGFTSKAQQIYFFLKYVTFICFRRPNLLLRFVKVIRHTKEQYSFSQLVQFLGVLRYQPNILHIQWAKSLAQWMWVKNFGVKLVLSLRGAHINYSPLANKQLAESYSANFPKVDAFHAVSKAIAGESMKYGACLNRIKVIYSGLNTSEFSWQPHWKKPENCLKIISVGRPHWIKGYVIALDALAALKTEGFMFHYTIVGGASEEMLYQIHDLNLSQEVTITDNLPFSEVTKQIHSNHLLLLPSLEEGIANVVLESMALGTLVLSSDCGGMKEALEDGKNGFIFQNRNRKSLIQQLKLINALSADDVDSILIEARSTIEKNFNLNLMVDGFVDLYASALSPN